LNKIAWSDPRFTLQIYQFNRVHFFVERSVGLSLKRKTQRTVSIMAKVSLGQTGKQRLMQVIPSLVTMTGLPFSSTNSLTYHNVAYKDVLNGRFSNAMHAVFISCKTGDLCSTSRPFFYESCQPASLVI
jgi:hypothetical protein